MCTELERDIQELTAQNKGIKDKIHEDIYMYVQRSKTAEERVRELHTLLLNKNKELDSAQEVIRKLKREYQSTRQDAEGMLQVMSGLERQLLGYTGREAEVERLAKENKEKVEVALIERDRAIGRQEQLSKELERMLQERKTIMLSRQSEIDLAIEQTRMKCGEQLKALEADLQKLAESNGALKVESERTIREGKTYRENYDRLIRLLEDERKAHTSAVKELSEKLTTVHIAREEEAGKREEIQELNKELRNTIDKLRMQIDTIQTQNVQMQRSKDVELSNLKGILRNNQVDIAEKERVLNRRKKELEDMKHTLDSEIANAERKHSEETLHLRRRVLDNENMIKDLENNSVNNLKQHQLLVEQLSEKHDTAMKQLSAKYAGGLNDLTDNKTKLMKVTDALNDITSERDSLLTLIAEAKQTINQLDNDNSSAKKTIIELTDQLSQSMIDRAEVVSKTKGVLEKIENSRKSDFDKAMEPSVKDDEEIIHIEEDYEIDEEEEDDESEEADD
jgi:chromosome segregation ATPase